MAFNPHIAARFFIGDKERNRKNNGIERFSEHDNEVMVLKTTKYFEFTGLRKNECND